MKTAEQYIATLDVDLSDDQIAAVTKLLEDLIWDAEQEGERQYDEGYASGHECGYDEGVASREDDD